MKGRTLVNFNNVFQEFQTNGIAITKKGFLEEEKNTRESFLSCGKSKIAALRSQIFHIFPSLIFFVYFF